MNVLEIIILVLCLLIVVGIGVVIYLFIKKKQDQPIENNDKNIEVILERLNNLSTSINTQISNQFQESKANTETLTKTLTGVENNTQKFLELKQEVSKLKEQDLKNLTEKQVDSIKEINNLINSVQNNLKVVDNINKNVDDLNNIFYNTKKRGNVGEFTLETLLTNILGNDDKIWESQYQVYTDNNTSNKGLVDFVIHTGKDSEDIIIDSKFPLDNYRELIKAIENKESEQTVHNLNERFKKDVKEKVNEVTKYLNHKNKLNSAILFIPSESIFNYVVDEYPDVIEYAIDKKVWLTSPTGLAALLNIVYEFLRDYELNSNLEKIKNEIIKVQKEYDRFSDRWDKILRSIKTLSDAANDLNITVGKISNQQQNIIDYQFDEE